LNRNSSANLLDLFYYLILYIKENSIMNYNDLILLSRRTEFNMTITV